MARRKSYKYQSILEFTLVAGALILLNLVLSSYFFRIDLTKEKRYSLSGASKKMAASVDELMYVKVYLEGEFPAGFKRLGRATREMLDEFRVYSKNNIQYEFIDPFKDADDKKSNDIIRELNEKGLVPTNVQVQREDEFSQKIIVPGALVFYKGREYPLNLLKGQFGQAPENVINSSVELLEYEIANVLRKATEKTARKIAFIKGHGELESWDIVDAKAELQQYYVVEDIDLTQQVPDKLKEYSGLVIPKPRYPFSEFDKFKIDQYVMSGGKILWLLDTELAEMDSLQGANMFVSASYDTRIDDLLFRYGVRVNHNMIQDLQCNGIPVLSGMKDGVPQQKLLPWLFYPVMPPSNNHPVVKGIDPVWFQFASSIDTTNTPKIRKTVLLQSSPASRVVSAPVRIDLNLARLNFTPDMFKGNGLFTAAVLLEGEFRSNFQHRVDAKDPSLKFIDKIDHNKMIVVSDGDVIRNQRKKSTGEVLPLGYDRYTNQDFGNKRFILNCIDYLCDESGIIEIRSKEVTLRLLNKGKVKREKLYWQTLNMVVPVLALLLFGVANRYWRKRKYS